MIDASSATDQWVEVDAGSASDPGPAIEALSGSTRPHLIGVRHHSPALAGAMDELLTAADPEVLAIELPTEAGSWVEWLAHEEVRAPVALALGAAGSPLAFYPFADFSPELVALRWARARGVPVECIDLPVAAVLQGAEPEDGTGTGQPEQAGRPEYLRALAEGARATTSSDETWDRMVEARATGASAESVRRAALAHGWAVRLAAPPDPHTLAREEHMAGAIAHHLDAGRRVTALVGSYHAAALLDRRAGPPFVLVGETRGALVGYTFAQLDSRSGYPAGIRDPRWQQLVVGARRDPAAVGAAATTVITEVTRELRTAGHPAGPGEAAEAVRVALDLATLRGLAAPARREVIEAVTTVHAQGDVLGRGRAVAAAAQRVLVSERTGQVAPGTPVSALRERVLQELAAAKLPVEPTSRTLTLKPLGGGLDLTRHVLLRRMLVARIPYASPREETAWRGAERVTSTWDIGYSAATEAGIDLAAAGGLTLAQVVDTVLRTRLVTLEADDAAPTTLLALLVDAADAASPVTGDVLDRVVDGLPASVGFAAAVSAAAVLADVARARLPGAGLLADGVRQRGALAHDLLVATAVRELDGLAGSTEPDDARGLAALVRIAEPRRLGLEAAVRRIVTDGSALMQGAAHGILLSGDLGEPDVGASTAVASWVDQAGTPDGRRALRDRITGLLAATGVRVESSDGFDALVRRVGEISDDRFVEALPALRGGFDALGSTTRADVLAELGRRLGGSIVAPVPVGDDELVQVTRYDQTARSRLAALGLADLAFTPAERWRLVLGRSHEPLSECGGCMASALDELYGHDGGCCAGRGGSGGSGGSDDPAQPVARTWSEELRSLFGEDQMTEILGEAAAAGRVDVLAYLDPAAVHPSTELLSTMLTLSGALPEARLQHLRPIVRRLVEELSARLATRLRPALAGLDSPRRTRRRARRLDLPGTVRANLRHVVHVDGRAQIVPVTPIFRQRVAREADWHIIVVVDVSGSMETSVLYSAMTAAILAGVRCLEVTFLAFSTEVVDLSDHVDDPLSLLLEISVGGGTDIASALDVAASRVRVPSRTLLALVTDFEEGRSVPALLAQVARLRDSGVTMLGCAALDDAGSGTHNVGIAEQVSAAGMRVARVSPLDLARWVAQVVTRS